MQLPRPLENISAPCRLRVEELAFPARNPAALNPFKEHLSFPAHTRFESAQTTPRRRANSGPDTGHMRPGRLQLMIQKKGGLEDVGSSGRHDVYLCPDPGRLPVDREAQGKKGLRESCPAGSGLAGQGPDCGNAGSGHVLTGESACRPSGSSRVDQNARMIYVTGTIRRHFPENGNERVFQEA